MDTECPETHFWCSDKDFCLPVFVRCNGVYDCPGHEDEEGCDMYTCPGFYRCRASSICIHTTHICDDWPLCPQQDDELLCNRSCPRQCTCHGLAFFCSHVFAAHQYPDLRYLDVRGSGMKLHQLDENYMLIHLSLARCRVTEISNSTFHHLHSLDLSDNLLTEVSVHHFGLMPQLNVLFLSGNPLTSVFTTAASSITKLHKITVLDLSNVKIHSVDSSLFTVFPQLHTLNLSHSGAELKWNSSRLPMVSLRELDLRGCMIAEISQDVLRGFLHLQLLHTDNFKLCCPSVLPPRFDLDLCHVAGDDISTCDDLLGSMPYQPAVAVLATLTLLGNAASLTVRVGVGSTWRLSSGGVVLTHLSVADLGTGLHLVTLGLADRLLAGQYAWKDNTWKRGVVCHMAGVLAMSCRQAATFFITILTLDHCLRYNVYLTYRLTPAKVKVICLVIWVSSLLLAVVPLMSQWRFFGQQALCVPLPHKMSGSIESQYAHGVMVQVHFIMFILCSVFEVISSACSRAVKSNCASNDHCPKNYQYVELGMLASGFLYTIACLVPTVSHTDSHKDTHTALVYFGSVVSSAMNPYLHLYGVRAERRQRIKEERLLRIVSRARV